MDSSPFVSDEVNPNFYKNPYPTYADMRSRTPVFRDASNTLILSRYNDVAQTLRGKEFGVDPNRMGGIGRGVSGRKKYQSSILTLDPPDHTRLRRIVSSGFTPSAVERFSIRTQGIVDAALDSAEAAGRLELIEDLAAPLPFLILCELLGISAGDSDKIREWSAIITLALEPEAGSETLDLSESAIDEMIVYFFEVVDKKRSNLGDDLLSVLIVAEDEGDQLSIKEMIAFLILLCIAGHETTVNLIGNAMFALLNNRDQLDLWRSDPSLDDNAIDELLRFDGPVQHTLRTPFERVEYVGLDGEIVVAEPGDSVLTLLGSANRDPEMFADPDRLWLARPNADRHLAFAAGIHYCLGAFLAKLEAKIVLSSFIRRFATIEMLSEPEFRDRFSIRGLKRMELKVSTEWETLYNKYSSQF